MSQTEQTRWTSVIPTMTINPGIYYPVPTPFDETEDVDIETLTELLEFGIDRGIHGIFALGSIGQGPVMSVGQRKRAIETTVAVADGDVPVIAHIGTPDTHTSVELAVHAEETGVDMLASLVPYYYSSASSGPFDHDEYELIAHFRRIADATDIDLLLYNNPSYTGVNLTPEQVARFIDHVPAISGIKSGRTPPEGVFEFIRKTPETFVPFVRLQYLLPMAYHGAHGAIHPPTVPFPELATEFWDAVDSRETDRALELQRRIHQLTMTVVEYANDFGRGIYVDLFALRGIEVERYPKWETRQPSQSERENLRTDLADIGLGAYLTG